MNWGTMYLTGKGKSKKAIWGTAPMNCELKKNGGCSGEIGGERELVERL